MYSFLNSESLLITETNSDKTISNIIKQNRIFTSIQSYLNTIKILNDIKKSGRKGPVTKAGGIKIAKKDNIFNK